MKLPGVESIIFDAEGVVIDTEGIWDRNQSEFLECHGVQYRRDELKPLISGRTLLDGVRIMQTLYGIQGDLEELAAERLSIARRLFQTEILFMPGFLGFFKRVRKTYRTCIATTLSGELLDDVERALHLKELFGDHIYSAGRVGVKAKPAPDIFMYAARKLGTRTEACVVIEDSPLGLEAAHAAGMRCIGITTTYPAEGLSTADLIVDRFEDLDRWL